MKRICVVLMLLALPSVVAQAAPEISIGGGSEQKQKPETVSREEFDELRWEIDDLKLRNRSPEELAEAMKAGKDHPESAVVVSEDYPKWRLPYGVKIDDQRPKEIIAAAIERCKAGKGIAYMWLSFPRENGKELRVYMTKVDWRDPKTAKENPAK